MAIGKVRTASELVRKRRFKGLVGLVTEELLGSNLYTWYLSNVRAEDGLIVQEFSDFELFLDPLDDGLSHELLHWGEREAAATAAYRAELRILGDRVTDPVILDIGANKGYFAFQGASLLPNATVHAIEPDPQNVMALRRGVIRNRFENVVIHEQAIGKTQGYQRLHLSSHANRHTLLEPPDEMAHLYNGRTVDVPVRSLDGFIDGINLNPSDVNVLRFDLEGFEVPVMKGATNVLDTAKDLIIFLEVHPHRVGTKPIIELLNDLRDREFELVLATDVSNPMMTTYTELFNHCADETHRGSAEVIFKRQVEQ
ncbi:FkbM family methyltransferase [Natronosalvus vescus]|uniref:FkbM family methyltransferase n=1 Tax=Natronosalvus vescus TaxID=2953881 RepID=UPI002091C334|nr:FkbM family methyltransferase [Natronosalvus vescus]